jgi:glycosyltransferase involved in cell wall biosynthesis|tara:strand:+ start:1367 stop:2017 length:651 start_codon:yes stop_codon:yes gene_type:complete
VARYKLAIVIPAFNEEKTIGKVVESVKEYGIVIVVNDASLDNTMQVAKNSGAIVVNLNENKGYDSALNSGFKKADELNCDGVITFDADGQHDSKDINVFIKKLKEGNDLVLGVRVNTQRLSEWIFKLYTIRRYGWKDPLCGFKGYSMQLYRNRGWFDSFNSIGTELAMYGIINKYKYIEVDISIYPRSDKPRFSSVIVSNFIITKSMIKSLLTNYK